MNSMKYKGYAARIEFDADDRIFVGHLAGIRDVVGFHGSSVVELETAFHEAVHDMVSIDRGKTAHFQVMAYPPPPRRLSIGKQR